MKVYLTPSQITELLDCREKRSGTIAVELAVYTKCDHCNSDYLALLDNKNICQTCENMFKVTY